MKFLEWFAWSLIALFVALIFIASSVSFCHGAELTWGGQAPYDHWETPNAEFFMLDLKLERTPLAIQVQTSHTSEMDGRMLALHWRAEKSISFLRLFGGFGIRSGGSKLSYGPSSVLGHFGLTIGLRRLRVGFVHYSDPLCRHDKGRNFITVGWKW